MAARKSPFFDTATTLGKIVAFFGVSAICGVLAAGLLVPVAAATGMTASSSIKYFDQLPSELEVGPLSQPSRVLASDGTPIASFYVENREPVKLKDVSKTMKEAILSIEDSRFYEHGGVDVQGTLRALVNNIANPGARQGASTITQQYVNNVLNEAKTRAGQDPTLGASKDIGDKLREAKLAISVEKKFTKDEILEGYLNIVFFNPNAFGIEAAAHYFYGTSAKDLNLQQSATLAGMVQGPSIYNPIANPKAAKKRRNIVLGTMLDQGKITQKEYDKTIKANLAVHPSPVKQGCVSATMAPYFCTYVQHLITNDPSYGKTREDREKLLQRGGLTITTTLDPRAQKVAQKEVEKSAPLGKNPDKIGTAMSSVEPGTGNIVAMAQNTKIVAPKGQWSDIYNFNVDEYQNGDKSKPLGGAGGFQPGSTYKAVTLAAWLDAGKPLNEKVDASQLSYPAGYPWKASCAPKNWVSWPVKFKNFSEGYARPMTVLEGIKLSINSATMASASELDLCKIGQMAQDLGIHNGRTGKPINPLQQSSLIGGSENISPLTMASAYSTFASGGIHCTPRALVSVTDFTGKKYPVPAKDCKRTVDKPVAEAVNMALHEVFNGGSGYDIPLKVPAGVKTGTTDESVQTWVIGYTKGLSTASWVGNPDQYRSLNGLRFNGDGTTLPYVDGANFAGHAWQAYMEQVVRYYPTGGFTDPPSNLVYPPDSAPPPATNNDNNTGNSNTGDNSGGGNSTNQSKQKNTGGNSGQNKDNGSNGGHNDKQPPKNKH